MPKTFCCQRSVYCQTSLSSKTFLLSHISAVKDLFVVKHLCLVVKDLCCQRSLVVTVSVVKYLFVVKNLGCQTILYRQRPLLSKTLCCPKEENISLSSPTRAPDRELPQTSLHQLHRWHRLQGARSGGRVWAHGKAALQCRLVQGAARATVQPNCTTPHPQKEEL